MITVLYSDMLNSAAEMAGRTRDKLPPSEALMMQGYFATDLKTVWNKALWPELIPDPISVPVSANRQFSKNDGNGTARSITGNLVFNTPATLFTVSATTPAHGLVSGSTVIIDSAFDARFNGTYAVTVIDANTFTCPCIDFNAAFGDNGDPITIPQQMGDILGVTDKDPTLTTKYRDIPFEEKDNAVRIEASFASVFVEYVLPRPDLLRLSGNTLLNYPIPERFSSYLAMRAAGLLLQSDGLPGGAVWLTLAGTALIEELERVKLSDRRTAPRVRSGVCRPIQ